MKIAIRDGRPDETALLVRIMVESGTYTGFAHAPLDPETRQRLDIRVASVDGQVCGFAGLLGAGPDLAELDLVFVHRQWRGRGVGRALVDDANRTASTLGLVGTRVVAYPPVEGFFRRVGARRVATRPPTNCTPWFCPVLEFGIDDGASRTDHRSPVLTGS